MSVSVGKRERNRARGGRKDSFRLLISTHPSIETECQKLPKSTSGKRTAPAREKASEEADTGGKLVRRASLRRKFGALLRGSADLPAAINRSLQPIKRSLSFSKDLHRTREAAKPHRTRSVQWYNSLSSLAEDERLDEVGGDDYEKTSASEEEAFDGRMQVIRTRSLMEKNPVRALFSVMKKRYQNVRDMYSAWRRGGGLFRKNKA